MLDSRNFQNPVTPGCKGKERSVQSPPLNFGRLSVPFVQSRIVVRNFAVMEAALQVVVDDPASLQAGIDRDRAQILKTAPFQVLADFVHKASRAVFPFATRIEESVLLAPQIRAEGEPNSSRAAWKQRAL